MKSLISISLLWNILISLSSHQSTRMNGKELDSEGWTYICPILSATPSMQASSMYMYTILLIYNFHLFQIAEEKMTFACKDWVAPNSFKKIHPRHAEWNNKKTNFSTPLCVEDQLVIFHTLIMLMIDKLDLNCAGQYWNGHVMKNWQRKQYISATLELMSKNS